MCGIVGYVGHRPALPILLDGLSRLEYRGYDSAGVAVAEGSTLRVCKTVGRVGDLESIVPDDVTGSVGIAHTRWATHGRPTHANAHPHTDATGRVAIVHNGIIENGDELREKLEAEDVVFLSDTDSEVLAHLFAWELRNEEVGLEQAVRRTLTMLQGSYGLAAIDAVQPDRIVVAANGSPVVIGLGNGESFVASGYSALVPFCRKVIRLVDGEIAVLRADGVRTFSTDGTEAFKVPTSIEGEESGGYHSDNHRHFMHKEIHDQPQSILRAIEGRIDLRSNTAILEGINLTQREVRSFQRVKILGCGSAYYAGQIGAGLIEELARMPADAEPASEFRYRKPVIEPSTLYVAVSQSGETVDTLKAVAEVRRQGSFVLGIVNVAGSAIDRESDGRLYLHAGPEVSVAATKSFTSMEVLFALLAVYLGRMRALSASEGARILKALTDLPAKAAQVMQCEDEMAALAEVYAKCSSLLFVGRVRGWPVAREGAQKLKEVSYIHAEAYQSSELKHGPLALVSPELPTLAVVPDDELLDKNLATLAEIRARNGPVIALAHRPIRSDLADHVVIIPNSERELDAILLTIPLQMFAYYTALARGNEVDRPRNLAKSVTVE